jgi:cytochrome c-type biogenesis protein CcmH
MRTNTLLGLCVMLIGIAPTAATELETEAKQIENLLMSPCCMTNTVAVHESGVSHQMRRDIREMLAAGRTKEQILDFYVERHGPQILAMPEAKGFSMTAYLFPLVFILVACVALAVALRRWRMTDRDTPPPAEHPAPAGPYAERLKRDMERLD